MIIKEYGEYVMTCDICGEQLEPQERYDDAIKLSSRYGWRRKKIDGQWENHCPDCQE